MSLLLISCPDKAKLIVLFNYSGAWHIQYLGHIHIIATIVIAQTTRTALMRTTMEGSLFANSGSILLLWFSGKHSFHQISAISQQLSSVNQNCLCFLKSGLAWGDGHSIISPLITDHLSSIKTFWHSYPLANNFANRQCGLISSDEHRVSPPLNDI